MSKTPTPTKMIDKPVGTNITMELPEQTKLSSELIEEVPKLKIIPEQSQPVDIIPEATPQKEEKPSDVIEENCVTIGGQKIEIKPTKLKYFRNKAASAYGIIKAVPIHELLTFDKGQLDPTRNADQLLYDFLVATFDDSTFVRNNYDELDADVIDKIVKIFGRINHIDEKEEAARKNREAQAQAKR